MNRLFKSSALSAALVAATLTAIPAEAHDRSRNDGDELAAGILGFALGAIVSSQIDRPRHYPDYYVRRHVSPRYHYYDPNYYQPYYKVRRGKHWYRGCKGYFDESGAYHRLDPC